MNVPRKYGLLSVVALILRILAWVVLAAGAIGAIVVLSSAQSLPPGFAGIGAAGVLVLAVIWFVQLFAFGSILSLLIDIEENTRALAGRTD